MEIMQEETARIRDEVQSYRTRFEALKKFAIVNKIPLPPELTVI